MENKSKHADKIPLLLLSALCLLLKVGGFALWWQRPDPHTLPLILLSCAYYVGLAMLCFSCGRSKAAGKIVAAELGVAVLAALLLVIAGSRMPEVLLNLIRILTITPSYAIHAFLHAFEGACQILSDWYYFAAFALVQIVFAVISLTRKPRQL